MPRSMTASPGPWKNERTPYLVGLMDAIAEEGVEQVVFLKAVQVGFSESLRNVLGYWIDHDPGPVLLVMPSEQSARELVDERIRPLLSETPRLREYVSRDKEDNKVHHTRLSSMSVFIGWAGSPQALASRPIRYIVFDEVDKYPPFAGKEADPISLGMKRLTTYGTKAKAFIGSTPTTRVGAIWQAWEKCTQQRHFHVPCPHCGEKQVLRWDRVKFPEAEGAESRQARAERIEAGELARYECEHCGSEWTNAEKNTAVRKGEWASNGGSPRRVGFHLNSIYSPWVSISTLAAEFLRAKGDPAALMDFANSRLAEPFEEQASHTKSGVFEEKALLAGEPMLCPAWTEATFCAADVQKGHLWYVIRAWGAGGRSQLVRYGMVGTFEELRMLAFGGQFAMADGQVAVCDYLAIDSRYRSNEVYDFAASDPARILPVMGSSKNQSVPLTRRNVAAYPGVIQRTVNPNHWKDVLHGLIHSEDRTQWLPHSQVAADYCKQMASEHKIHDRKAGTFVWQQVSAGNDNHIWDCETMQCMLANECGLFVMDALATGGDPSQEATESPWLDNHRGNWT
ncbi:MAG: terminase gpA endonuclease subunit [Planctomycetota bacterium]